MELRDESSIQPDVTMLTDIEVRVLGALMEKQLTTPDAYPITLNSLVLACNQKTSREPVSHYDSGELQRCASQLQDKNLIVVDYNARAARYDQRLTRVLSMDKPTQALLNIMLLRGPQTSAELLTRTQRMFEFENLTAINEKLEQLCAKTTPYFIRIPRAPGQREDRYTHLLCGKPDFTAIAAMTTSVNKSAAQENPRLEQLERRIDDLENELKSLRNAIKTLAPLNPAEEFDL